MIWKNDVSLLIFLKYIYDFLQTLQNMQCVTRKVHLPNFKNFLWFRTELSVFLLS